eukprot:6381635-Amphidinium_carterae.2
MMRAERAAWRRVSILLHEGVSLPDAIQQVRQDSLFWVREVYEHIRPPSSSAQPLPPNKRMRMQPPQFAPSGKGVPKGKGKQKPLMDTSKWGTHDNAGLEICRNYHFGICKSPADKCRRSHLCPNLKLDGTTCSGHHTASGCPLSLA